MLRNILRIWLVLALWAAVGSPAARASYTQNFDGMTSGATTLSGWTLGAGYQASTTVAHSSPNSLRYGSSGATSAYYNTENNTPGYSQTSLWFDCPTYTSGQQILPYTRCTINPGTLTTMTCYMGDIEATSSSTMSAHLIAIVGGTQTVIGSTVTFTATYGAWYQVLVTANGTTITLQVYNGSQWLNSSGTFVTDATGQTAVSTVTNDTHVSAADGYNGLFIAGVGATDYVYIDDFAVPMYATANLLSSGITTSQLSTTVLGGVPTYTYQWYRSTTSGFTPGSGNILSGDTSSALSDTGLTSSGVTYYYIEAVTDSTPTTIYTAQVAMTTLTPAMGSGSDNFDSLTVGNPDTNVLSAYGGNWLATTTGNISSPNALGPTSYVTSGTANAPVGGNEMVFTGSGAMVNPSGGFDSDYLYSTSQSYMQIAITDSTGANGYVINNNTLYKFTGGPTNPVATQIGLAIDFIPTPANGTALSWRIFYNSSIGQIGFKMFPQGSTEPAEWLQPPSWVDTSLPVPVFYVGAIYTQGSGYTGGTKATIDNFVWNSSYAATPTNYAFTIHPNSSAGPILARSGQKYDMSSMAAPSVWRNTLLHVNTSTGLLTDAAVGGSVIAPKWMMQYSAINNATGQTPTESYQIGSTYTVPATTWTVAMAYASALAGPWTLLSPSSSNVTTGSGVGAVQVSDGGNPVITPITSYEGALAADGTMLEVTFGTDSGVPSGLRGQTLLAHYYESFVGGNWPLLMTSPDGMTWTRWGVCTYNPLAGHTYGSSGIDPAVILNANTGKLELYAANTVGYLKYICRATSSDGFVFTQTDQLTTDVAPYSVPGSAGVASLMGSPGPYVLPGDSNIYFLNDTYNIGSGTAQRRYSGHSVVAGGSGGTLGVYWGAYWFGQATWENAQVFDPFAIYANESEGPRVYLFHAGSSTTGSFNMGAGAVDAMQSQIGLAYRNVTLGSSGRGRSLDNPTPARGRILIYENTTIVPLLVGNYHVPLRRN